MRTEIGRLGWKGNNWKIRGIPSSQKDLAGANSWGKWLEWLNWSKKTGNVSLIAM
jgi:hypothetical protein